MSEVIWPMLICFAAGMSVTAAVDLIRDLIQSRKVKRKLKRAMVEYGATVTVEESSRPPRGPSGISRGGIEYARCTCDGCRAIADVAAARATLNTNEGNQS